MHIHEVLFQVVDRQPIFVDEANGTLEVDAGSTSTPPEPWEHGFKDTFIAYPRQVTRVRAQFGMPGQYVWHCHIASRRARGQRDDAAVPRRPAAAGRA